MRRAFVKQVCLWGLGQADVSSASPLLGERPVFQTTFHPRANSEQREHLRHCDHPIDTKSGERLRIKPTNGLGRDALSGEPLDVDIFAAQERNREHEDHEGADDTAERIAGSTPEWPCDSHREREG